MRILLVFALTIVLTQASFLDTIKDSLKAIGHGISQTTKDFLPYAANVTKGLLKQAETGAVSALSKTLLDVLLKGVGKREDDATVDLVTDLGAVLHLGTKQFTDVIDNTFSEIKTLRNELMSFTKHPQQVIHEVENLIGKHSSLSTDFLHALERDINLILHHHDKRDVGTDLSSFGTSIANLFKPAIDGIFKIIQQAGQLIKNAATNLLGAAQNSVAQMGHSLLGDLGTLIQHSTHALNAVKGVTGQLLNQPQH